MADCSVEGCAKEAKQRGLCHMHYSRQRRTGSVHTIRQLPNGRTWEDAVAFYGKQVGNCLEWTGGRYKHGYGAFNDGTGIKPVSKVAWEQVNGPVPDGLEVRHLCGNPPCFLIEHLTLGTHAENMQDMVVHGRSTRGDRQPNAVLTSEDVVAIRDDQRAQAVIAADYGVSRQTISDIKRRKSWAWL